MKLLAAALAASTSLVCACTSDVTSDPSDVAASDADYRSKPKGPDTRTGALVVHAPALAAGTTLESYTLEIAPGHGRGELGKPAARLLEGDVSFSLTTSAHVGSHVAGKVRVEPGKTSEVRLGGIAVKLGEGSGILGIPSLGSSGRLGADVDLSPADAPNVRDAVASIHLNELADGTKTVAAFPGTYLVPFTPIDGVAVTVTAGSTATVDVRSHAERRVARVVFANAELPAGCTGHQALVAYRAPKGGVPGATQDGYLRATVREDAGPSVAFEVGENDRVIARRNGGIAPSLRLVLPCVVAEMPLATGALGAGPRVVELGRVDVDDVDVVADDGSTRKVRGSYALYDAATGAAVLSRELPTGTGVDVPSGTYRLVVSYAKAGGGGTGRFEEVLTTP